MQSRHQLVYIITNLWIFQSGVSVLVDTDTCDSFKRQECGGGLIFQISVSI